MPGFMNAELERIRDNLTCAHCASVFAGSDSQARKVKYELQRVFCSTACRHAYFRNMYSTPIPNRGPCGTCGKPFFSRTAKQFCSIVCYTKSSKFASMLAESRAKSLRPESREKIASKLRKGNHVNCLECGTVFYAKRDRPQKFCSKPCYRAYLSKRFDRWIANPEGLALPQCYDEFLDRHELACVISGCDWRGIHLSLHINQAHGLPAKEFKRAAGFNISTGVIGKGLAMTLRQRNKAGVATEDDHSPALALAYSAMKASPVIYRSRECAEHIKKGRLIAGPGPQRICKSCGSRFTQSTPFGRAVYCSIPCRTAYYARAPETENEQ